MQTPNLNRVYGSFFKIEDGENHISVLRTKVSPLIERLKADNIIGWYAFHFHERKQYNPEPKNRSEEKGIHFRLELLNGKTVEDLITVLPDYCEDPILGIEKDISGITVGTGKKHLISRESLKNSNISDAWKVIGEASEWVLNLLDSYKTEVFNNHEIYNGQIIQHIHFIMNLLQPRYTHLQDGSPISPVNGALLF